MLPFRRGSTAVEMARLESTGACLAFETYALGGQGAAQVPGVLMPYEAAARLRSVQDAINGLGALIGRHLRSSSTAAPAELIGLARGRLIVRQCTPDNWDEWAAASGGDTSRANDY